MRTPNRGSEAGFTLVELTVVVVISTLALLAIYETLITQERTYRYQTAAIDTQGSTRAALSLLVSEMREISASAGGASTDMSGSDLIVAEADSIRFRAFRKVGIVCDFNRLLGTVDVWVPGVQFELLEDVMVFQEGDSITDQDDRWVTTTITSLGSAVNAAACSAQWGTYPTQGLQGMLTVADSIERGALIRSFETLTYGAYQYDGDWVVGRRNSDGTVIPLLGPVLNPREGGLRFRYFDINDAELTPATEAERSLVSRVEITVRAMSRGGIGGQYVDSLTTNVYLRGN